MRFGPCKIDLSPPVILFYLSFKCDTSVVVLIVLCFGVVFLCCLNLMYEGHSGINDNDSIKLYS